MFIQIGSSKKVNDTKYHHNDTIINNNQNNINSCCFDSLESDLYVINDNTEENSIASTVEDSLQLLNDESKKIMAYTLSIIIYNVINDR